MHESAQRGLFRHPPGADRVAVWKGRSFEQYDPHGNDPAGYADWRTVLDFVVRKRSRTSVFKRLFPPDVLDDPGTHPIHRSRIAFRDVTNRTNSRTVIACLVPPDTPLTDTAPYLIHPYAGAPSKASVLAIFNSVPFDWLARRYAETHLKYFILNSLTFPPPADAPWQRIGALAARLSCVDERFADFAAEAEVDCGPLPEPERAAMRAEIDALAARAYGLTADELRFIFTDFTENALTPAYREQVMAWFEQV